MAEERNAIKEEYLEFLDTLRESGVVNMYGSSRFLQEEYGMDRKEARKIVTHWMETFAARHNKELVE